MPAPAPNVVGVTQSAPAKTLTTIEDVLLDQNVLKKKDYDQVKLEVVSTGTKVEDLLIEKNLVTDQQIAEAKSILFGVPYVQIAGKTISPDVLTLIPEQVAKQYGIIPFERHLNDLWVALDDPLNLQVVKFLEQKTNMGIKVFLSGHNEIKDAIELTYSQSLTGDIGEVLKEANTSVLATESGVTKVKAETLYNAPIAKVVSQLLEYGIKIKASDVHIEPMEDKVRIRYRIDGILHEKLILPKKVHEAIVARIKILAKLKIDEKRLPQDGRFDFESGQEAVDLRVSSLPTTWGEKVVMRLLKKSGGIPTLSELGLRGTALKNVEMQLTRPHGVMLITGPTGSGKTTTLYSALARLNTAKVNILTLEDPVEYQIAGVNQVQINTLAGLTFASGLRSFLRQDPNIIMVGEIRDEETADLAVQAALTGHMVFSTVHTNNASGALPRLLDMKIEPYLIASSITAVVGQRVVRKICVTCREKYVPVPEIITDIKSVLGRLLDAQVAQGQMSLYRGKGCEECNGTGYLGRIGIYEVLILNEKIGRLILERETSEALERQAVEDGMVTMKQDGYLKVVEGITTIEEVLRVAQE